MLTEKQKKKVIANHLDTILGIADKEYQERVWIRAEGPEVDDFDETCNFFFDIGDPILESYQEYGLSENQYLLLKKFRDEFEAFSDDNSWPPFFIDSPEWARIMERAKEVLEAFNYKKLSES